MNRKHFLLFSCLIWLLEASFSAASVEKITMKDIFITTSLSIDPENCDDSFLPPMLSMSFVFDGFKFKLKLKEKPSSTITNQSSLLANFSYPKAEAFFRELNESYSHSFGNNRLVVYENILNATSFALVSPRNNNNNNNSSECLYDMVCYDCKLRN